MAAETTAKPTDVIAITFVIMQDGKLVKKEVKMTKQTFLDYNAKPKTKFADMYEMIVRDNVYISITDLGNSN